MNICFAARRAEGYLGFGRLLSLMGGREGRKVGGEGGVDVVQTLSLGGDTSD